MNYLELVNRAAVVMETASPDRSEVLIGYIFHEAIEPLSPLGRRFPAIRGRRTGMWEYDFGEGHHSFDRPWGYSISAWFPSAGVGSMSIGQGGGIPLGAP